jgi:hypothetical protein
MEQLTAPYGQIIELRQIVHESGVRLLRVIVRDGGHYTTLDLDRPPPTPWGKNLMAWADNYDKA